MGFRARIFSPRLFSFRKYATKETDMCRKTVERCLDRINLYNQTAARPATSVTPLTMNFCNGYTSTPFDEAFVSYDENALRQGGHQLLIPHDSLFETAIKSLTNFVNGHALDEHLDESLFFHSVTRLHKFLSQASQTTAGTNYSPNHTVCLLRKQVRYESEKQFLLAEHLFSRLTPDQGYLLNTCTYPYVIDGRICPCGICKASRVRTTFGIGHSEVWHGQPDILLTSVQLPVIVPDRDQEKRIPSSPMDIIDGHASVEVDNNQRLSEAKVYPEAVATTIVNSFLLAKEMCLQNFLIPCFVSTLEKCAVYFYDCDNDILLRTATELDFRKRGSRTLELDEAAIFYLWLCLNSFVFKPELSEDLISWMKKTGRQSNFHKICSDSLDIYRNELVLTVGSSVLSDTASRDEILARLLQEQFPTISISEAFKKEKNCYIC